jgi:tetratricopeptide (TPR) repeat protein
VGTAATRIASRSASRWWPGLAVALVTLAAFSPVLSNQFVDWDDGANFVNNPSYRGFGWTQLRWMATAFHQGVYQPLAWLLAAVEYRIGMIDPWVYHAGSWLLHAVAAVLAYALARRLLIRLAPDRPGTVVIAAAVAALAWAVHPLRVETVAWASAQGYTLAAVFALGSVLTWLQARDAVGGAGVSSRVWYLASVVLATCAYLSKPIAVTLPAVFLILEWYLPAARSTARWLALLPYAIPAVLVASAAPLARLRLGASPSAGYSLIDRLAQACYGAIYYPAKTLVPTGLTVFSPLPRPFNPFELRFAAAVIAVGIVGGLIWWAARRAKGLAAIALAHLILLAPVLGIIRQGDQLVADRYSYFAGVPLALAVGAGLLVVATRTTRRIATVLMAAAVAAVVVLSVATWRLAHVWRDAGALWAHAIAVDPASYQAHTNFGLFELKQGRYDEAVDSFDEAIRLNPASSNARFDRGLALAKSGRTREAIASYEAGLRIDPMDATAHAHLGELLGIDGRLAEAEAEYRAALRLVPHPDLFNSLGVLLAQQDRLTEAVAAFREALALDPHHADARANLDTALAMGVPSGGDPR